MFKPGQGIRLRGSARTNTGRVRDNNEDNVHLWIGNSQMVLAVVADGMGGAVAGEEASRIAIEAIQNGMAENGTYAPEEYFEMTQDKLVNHLVDSIRSANINIVHQAKQFPELKGMGTTVTLAMVLDTSVVVGHVGDSRAYLVESGSGHIEQITSDHSFVQALVAAGHISEEEAEDHPMKNVLYRALGQAADLEIDVYYEQLQIGDRLVLCSDGLTLHVKPHEIAELAMADEPDMGSQQLIDLANKRGGRDNVSVIIIKVEEDPDYNPDADESDTIEIIDPDFDDDDTLIMPRDNDFSSSESSESIQESPDTNINHHKAAASSLSTSTSTNAVVKMVDSKVDESTDEKQRRRRPVYDPDDDPPCAASENFGEGHDPLMPDQ